MTQQPPDADGPRRRLVLLASQAFALGLTVSWMAVSATSLFLEEYGSGALPVTYIGAAVAGAAATALMSRTLRTRPLSTVAVRTLTLFALVLVAAWVLLRAWEATWVSFALLVLFPIVVPVGFVFIVGQAGMLLDVRTLKSSYPRVIAGFAFGVFVGGMIGPVLLAALDTADLLLTAAVAVATLTGLVAATRRTFPVELSVISHEADPAERPTLRSLLSNRFVVLIITFQMLSALESQWLEFLVNDRASQRYTQTSDLATFLSRFFALAYGLDIVFLVLLAGLLLRRFGLRYGLTGNPAVVFTLVVAMIVATLVSGSGATVVFLLVVASRAFDLTLADGAARASLSAAYQAVPSRERTAAQAVVEGLGVPVAIGFSGVILLVLRATVGTRGLALPVVTSVVVLVWGIVALLVFRGYRVSLLANLRHRVLDPSELTLDETSGLELIDRLLDSDDDHDVRLGLDALAASEHPEHVERLVRLATEARPEPRAEALERLVPLEPATAREVAILGLDHPSGAVRVASVRTLAAVGGPADVGAVTALTGDLDDEVQIAAFSALARIGGRAAGDSISAQIAGLARDPEPGHRILAARILGECQAVAAVDRGPLPGLLDDADTEVVKAALAATGHDDVEVLDRLIRALEEPRTAGAAVEALVRGGQEAIEKCDEGLRGELALDPRGQQLLTRVCRERGDRDAVAVLRRHLRHPDREVGLAVMTALAATGDHPDAVGGSTDTADEPLTTALVRTELEHATRVLQLLDAAPPARALRLALRDELSLTRRRVLADLSLRHGVEGVDRVTVQLDRPDPRLHAVALEWLEVTLAPGDRLAITFLDPGLTDEERLRAMTRVHPVPPLTPAGVIADLVLDRDGRWFSAWLIGSALLAASEMPEVDLDALIEMIGHDEQRAGVSDVHGLVPETIAGIRQRQAGAGVAERAG
ncbi:MAG TPA: hypothetical protein VJM33_14105 [Microthrixaceae bacterium]|nr:hypothetical protein [Microthrixaceae bacterium]